MNALRLLGCLAPFTTRDAVGDRRLELVRQLDRLQLVVGRADVGDVDEAGVDRALGELADDPPDVGLLGAHVRRIALLSRPELSSTVRV